MGDKKISTDSFHFFAHIYIFSFYLTKRRLRTEWIKFACKFFPALEKALFLRHIHSRTEPRENDQKPAMEDLRK